MRGHEIWMIPILMTLFAIGGTTYGMAEETLAFYAILIPLMLTISYDPIIGVAIILIGAGIGVLGSTINPFATVIASNAANIAFTEGMALRFILLIGGLIICSAYVMSYVRKVKKDSSRSVVASQSAAHKRLFLRDQASAETNNTLTGKQIIVLCIFSLSFTVMIWGVASQGR